MTEWSDLKLKRKSYVKRKQLNHLVRSRKQQNDRPQTATMGPSGFCRKVFVFLLVSMRASAYEKLK
jgi:hypothetical protein